MTALDYKIGEMASRIKELRELLGLSVEEMAKKTDVSAEEYTLCESGEQDLNFAFIYRCALALNVNVTDIIEGYSPTLKSYTVTRRGTGQKVSQAHGMTYYNLAYAFQNRIAEPLYVRTKYDPDAEKRDIELTTHEGQECDIVVEGSLMVQVGEHKEVLGPGDSIYYDSDTPHGMIAVNGQDCIFYAIVLNPTGEPIPELQQQEKIQDKTILTADTKEKERVYHNFVDYEVNEHGTPTKVEFKNTDRFNFGFDVIDEISYRDPEKLAMIHISQDKTERRFTFTDVRHKSCQAANYFKSMGIQRGDRVMLVLKRHYQFWFAIVGLHKLGAIAIPATNQLQAHDFEYRFKTAGVSAILCTADGDTANEVDIACENYPQIKKIIVNGEREGWRNYDEESTMFSSHFKRRPDSPCGDDLMLMYFTSGTSGYPKIAAHSHKLALGHFQTAKFWHNVDPDGLHFTISDTGWAKAAWGKLYGQWLCEAPMFVYDFDRFHAEDILPMFAKYKITTFCAPPTMLRMMIKQDISKYDFSSVKRMTTAGEALNPEVYRQFEKATGLQIMEGFGQTETAVIICNMVGAPHKIGSMGKPSPIFDIHLIDKDGNEVPDGEPGEVVINISKGMPCGLAVYYYNDVEATKKTWRQGYYHTGDLAWRDEDGFYWYVGRADDVIKSSGYRIGPFEIESVIMELSYVLECGVSAAPDPIRGQVVKASIVLVDGTEGTEELKKEIQDYVKTHTAPYKYPRIVEFKKSLPKTVSGKIQRNLL
ncbi:MAG: AMP-binding protein [Ruminococcus sp.]|nr:AMP-binding protein [Ruminococcus sp.]